MQDLELMNVEELMEVKGGANEAVDQDQITITCTSGAVTCNGSPAI